MKRQTYKNPTLAAMTRAGARLDRETYIWWAFELDGDDELDPELEAELPAQFRRETLDERLTDKVQ